MPAHALSERAARAALSAHFSPGQLAADLEGYTPAEVRDQRVRRDGSRLPSSYRPHEELAQAELTCPFVIPFEQGVAHRPRRPGAGLPAGPVGPRPRATAAADRHCRRRDRQPGPRRLACARCPFYVPKDSARGQLLAVQDGIDQMLEQLDLTDDEREALEGDREAVTALAERLADTPTSAGPTPRELGTADSFVPLTELMKSIGTGEDHHRPHS